jgi:hypothetical protein
MRSRRLVLTPIAIISSAFVPFDPFVDPLSGVTKRSRYSRRFLPVQVAFDRQYPVALGVFLHRQLLSKKAAELESKSVGEVYLHMSFQRTVTDVVAHIPVTDVVALVNY